VCWANENWTRRWDGRDNDVLVAQRYSADADRRLAADLAPLFHDRRYIRVRDRPLFLVYRANSLPDPRAFAERFRDQARRDGSGDPFLACIDLPGLPTPVEWGFDAAVEFPPHGFPIGEVTPPVAFHSPGTAVKVWDYVHTAKSAIARPPADYVLFRGVMTSWDNTPRLPRNGNVFVNTHPANYERWLTAVVAQTAQCRPPEERFVFINAWNEWAEGCHLEPDEAFGRGYLEATRRALATGARA